MKYQNEIRQSSIKYDVSPELVASVINVESSYRSDIKSAKGAIGLMQILPSSAKWLCENLGVEYSEQMLYDPKWNIELGTYYLSRLFKDFKNSDNALCAYNAGPSNVKSWLKNKDYSTDGYSLNTIPFAETREYLGKIKKNIKVYRHRYK